MARMTYPARMPAPSTPGGNFSDKEFRYSSGAGRTSAATILLDQSKARNSTRVTVTFHALWMLCALGAVVYAAAAAPRVRDLAALAIGFVAAAMLAGPRRLPDPTWVGVISSGAAATVLFRPRFALASAAWGGALGGMLTAMTEVQGLHPIAAVALCATLLAITVWFARTRAAFAPDVLRDEALLAVCLLGLAVAIVPGVIDGWQAAANLTIESAAPAPSTPIPVWTLTLVATATALGAVYAVWSRR